jgi:hypothetical protein
MNFSTLFYTLRVHTHTSNLAVITVSSLLRTILYPKKHYVFKKMDFTVNPYFWAQTELSQLFYLDSCHEELTVQRIYTRITAGSQVQQRLEYVTLPV